MNSEWPDCKALKQDTEHDACSYGKGHRDRHRNTSIKQNDGKYSPEHQSIAMREVHRTCRRPHDMEADGDEGIDAANTQPSKKVLYYGAHDPSPEMARRRVATPDQRVCGDPPPV